MILLLMKNITAFSLLEINLLTVVLRTLQRPVISVKDLCAWVEMGAVDQITGLTVLEVLHQIQASWNRLSRFRGWLHVFIHSSE